MTVKTDRKYLLLYPTIVFTCCGLGCVIGIYKDFPLVWFISMGVLFLAYITFQTVVLSKTLIFSEDGCTVKLLWFKRFYRWSELETKRYIDLCELQNIDVSSLFGFRRILPYKSCAEFSVKKLNGSVTRYPTTRAIFLGIFSYFYVYFDSPSMSKSQKERAFEYLIDESEFRSKLQEWGVEMQEVSAT